MIALVVMTSPRPPGTPDYLSNTLKGLDENGADLCDEKIVSVDGLIWPPHVEMLHARGGAHRSWEIRKNNQRTGQRLALWRAFMLAQERNADWAIICEDDLNVAPGAVERIVSIARSNCLGPASDEAFLTFYDRHAVPEGAAPGFHRRLCVESLENGKWFFGTLCFLIHRKAIDYLLTQNPLKSFCFRDTYHDGDCVMAEFLSESPWPFYTVHVPTLIDHLGDVSLAGIGKERGPVRGNNFAGVRDPVWHEMRRPFHEVMRDVAVGAGSVFRKLGNDEKP